MNDSVSNKNELEIRIGSDLKKCYPAGTQVQHILEDNGVFVARDTVAAELNGELVDLHAPVETAGELKAISMTTPEGLEILRHSTSHLMASAVQQLFPEVKVAIGPAIDSGFYYDFDRPQPFTPEDLVTIEKKMKEILKKKEPFVRRVVSHQEAETLFKEKAETYKVEILKEITDPTVSLYELGGFLDLCRGPHLPSIKWIPAFKLTTVAGAYWKGDEKQPMLQRIYGTAFPSKEALKEHLALLEEAKKRDHRRLGKKLDLFSISDEVGPGLVCWHPRGAKIRTIIENFWREEHVKGGYEILYTPHIAKIHLWETSGHTDFYQENMYSPMDVEGQQYLVKPMNCPFHIQIFKSRLQSHRDMPKRWAELGTVYRYERSGVLHGLLRVRGFTQDDAHIFCRADQVEDEILQVIEFTLFVLKTFGFEHFDVYLSTRPEKYVGSLDNWELATEALKKALERTGLNYEIDPGEGVFYGPKIDIKIRDSLGRQWQCSTIQVDFNLPERFNMSYIGEDGAKHPVTMIHRALMGSLERFFGCLIEHYNGAFPVWLAPEQSIILPITDRAHSYASQVFKALDKQGIRAEIDMRNEKLGLKVREAQLRKIPYMVVLGDKEVEEKTLSVRTRAGENLPPMTEDDFIIMIQKEVQAHLGSK